MMRRMAIRFGVISLTALMTVSAASTAAVAAPITYDLAAYSSHGISISGSFQTDGTIGDITGSNMQSWFVTVTNGATSYGFTEANSHFGTLTGFTASATALTATPGASLSVFALIYNNPTGRFIFSIIPGSRMIIQNPIEPSYWVDCGIFNGPCTTDISNPTIATAQPTVDPSVVPEPTSLLLLGSGVLGLVARHRRRANC